MSALPPKADMCSALAHVCFGPIADIDRELVLGDDARTPVADRKFSRRLPQASYQDLAYHRGSCAAQRQERGRGRCRRIQRWQQRGGARASHILDIACVTPHIRYWHKADIS
jgi:hypothetical protein